MTWNSCVVNKIPNLVKIRVYSYNKQYLVSGLNAVKNRFVYSIDNLRQVKEVVFKIIKIFQLFYKIY